MARPHRVSQLIHLRSTLVIKPKDFTTSQAPHVSTAPQNGDSEVPQPRGRHYTVYGLSPVNKVDSEAYRKCWVLHVKVDEADVVTNTDFEKSSRNGRRYDYVDSQMRLLSVSVVLQLQAFTSPTPIY